MTNYVPVVVVIEEAAYRKLQDALRRTEFDAATREAIGNVFRVNGWTTEMISLGSMLAEVAKRLE